MTILGIDCSFEHPDYKAVKADGYSFVTRYLSHSQTPKTLTRAEAATVSAAGLNIVLVFEDSATRAKQGFRAGIDDATFVRNHLSNVGAPSDAPVYFAVDFDVTAGELGAVRDYFRGIGTVLPKAQIGAYGDLVCVDTLWASGLVALMWQTYAWSGGQWSQHTALQQYHNGARVAGADVDLDRATRSDYGGWKIMSTTSGVSHPPTQAAHDVWNADMIPIGSTNPPTDWTPAHTLGNIRDHVVAQGVKLNEILSLVRTLASPPVTPASTDGSARGSDPATPFLETAVPTDQSVSSVAGATADALGTPVFDELSSPSADTSTDPGSDTV